MQFLGFRVIFKRIKAIRFMMKDRSVPKRKKALIIAGIIYLFLPVDLIPPILFPIAWVDLSKKYRGKTVIDDVEYEVRDRNKKNRE